MVVKDYGKKYTQIEAQLTVSCEEICTVYSMNKLATSQASAKPASNLLIPTRLISSFDFWGA